MDLLQTLQWDHPTLLWGLATLPLLGVLLWCDWFLKRRLVHRWSQVPSVVKHSALPSAWRAIVYAGLVLGGFALAILGFASPILPTVTWEPAWERVALGLLLDVSPSMRASMDPYDSAGMSRLEVLKHAVQEVLTSLPGGVRVGMIAFAGVAVPIVPEPSADHQAVLAKIRRLDQTFIANPGTNLAAAIQQGVSLFVDPEADRQPATVSLILLSDGDTVVTRQLQTVLDRVTLPIYTLGIGALQPVPIPDPKSPTGWLTDTRGRPATTALNESLLRLIAERTGGAYYPISARDALVRTLRQLVIQQGQQVSQPVPRPRSARWLCFAISLGCLCVAQYAMRVGRLRQKH
jgi:hypothetical protein